MSPLPRKSPPPPDLRPSRSRGALLGLAVGDALGVTNEFKRLVAPHFPQRVDGPIREMTGGGPFKVRPGQVTDDTQMACALAASLRAVKGFSVEDVAQRYRAWKPHAFDVGNQTAAALDLLGQGYSPERAGRKVWLESSQKSAGNGSLMRTAPIGVFYADQPADCLRAAMADSAITHFDPRCQLACAAFDAAIAEAISHEGALEPKHLLDAAKRAITRGASSLAQTAEEFVRQIQGAAENLEEDLSFTSKEDPELFGPELRFFDHMGFVRLSFRFAFWELFHAESFEEALIDVVNRGGDSDTHGAITGALLGAYFGEEAIPSAWKNDVLGALEGRPGPLASTYHPRTLLRLVEG